MLRCDDWLICTDVSEERCVSIFRPDSSSRDQASVVLQVKALPPPPPQEGGLLPTGRNGATSQKSCIFYVNPPRKVPSC
jgi:hypothetical protein